MISKWLRCCLGLETALLVMAAAWLVWAGDLHPDTAVTLAVGVFFVLNSCPLIVVYAMASGLAPARSGEPKVGTLHAWRGAAGEWLTFLALFVVLAPFERRVMGGDAVGRLAPGRLPVLLVHGYFCNRGLWWWLRRRLRGRGLPVATINLEPPFGDIDGFAEQLHTRIEALVAETGVERVLLVAHSMGGLVARAYLRRHGPNRVAKLVTLASPHHGTRVAVCGFGLDAAEMRTNSPFIRELARQEPLPVPAVTIFSTSDEFVVPQDSSRLAGAREIVLPALGHLAMAFSPAVLECLQVELAPLP